MTPAWDAWELRVKSDSPRMARYRLLQSWWRQHELGVPPGRNQRGRLLGSMLPADHVRENPGLNFLSPGITAYAADRLAEVQAEGGTMEPDRLYRNLLSSQPLCFNLFGYLRLFPEASARVLRGCGFDQVAEVESIAVEWSPPPGQALADRTAFDAAVCYRTPTGRRGLLGVETKYTEPFSQQEYESAVYTELTERCGWFCAGAAIHLKARPTNQLWRNTLLTASTVQQGLFDEASCVVVALEDDRHAHAALEGVRRHMNEPVAGLSSLPIERLIAAAAKEPELAEWAGRFTDRYLGMLPQGQRICRYGAC